jgi:hypothetical protein
MRARVTRDKNAPTTNHVAVDDGSVSLGPALSNAILTT